MGFRIDGREARTELVAVPLLMRSAVLHLLWVAFATAVMAAPERVVSLAPSVTETILALGKGDLLIARTRYCPYPAEAPEIAVIEDMVQPSVERLLALRPDLILASDPTPEAVVAQMRKVRLNVVRLPTHQIDSVIANIERIAALLDEKAKGEVLTERLRRDLAEVNQAVKTIADRPRVVLFYGTDTAFCAGAGSFAGEILERAGGRNVAADGSSPWPALNRERLLSWNPQVIIVALTGDPADLQAARTQALGWQGDPLWGRLEAVRTGRIIFITGSLLMIPGPRVGEAARAMASVLHPALFPEAISADVHHLQP